MRWSEALSSLAELRPVAELDQGRWARRHASGCTLCETACPKDAIQLSELGATVEADACIGCGLCVPACPVQAISGVGQPPEPLAARIATGAAMRCDVARMLGENSGREVVDVPCVAGVAAETLAAGTLAADGATVVRGPCDACPFGSPALVHRTLQTAREIVASSASEAEIVEEEILPGQAPAATPARASRPRAAYSRRAMFGFARRRPVPELPQDATPRELLLASAPAPALPHLTADDSCTACEGCVRICPTDALSLDGGELRHAPLACVACGECVRVCPEDTLSFAVRSPERGPEVLLRVQSAHCRRCTRPLGPQEHDVCHNCASRSSLLEGIWDQL